MDQVAAELNNVAVAYLEAGDLRNALSLFRVSLRTAMGDFRPGEAPPAVPQMPAPPSAVDENGQPVAGSQRAKSAEFSNPSTPFIHAQGFGIVGTAGAYSPDPLVNSTIISTIVIFNLAVVYHIKGLHEKALSESRLVKAHSLYAKALLLLHDAGVTFGSTGNAVVDLLSMAVSNNLAHVCFELSSYDESRAYFDGLIRFALTVVPGRYGDQYVGSVMDSAKCSFLLNSVILRKNELAAAA